MISDWNGLENVRLPRGFGSVHILGKGRTRPYAVQLPGKKDHTYLCYTQTRIAGIAALTLWHCGKYEPGIERDLDRVWDKDKKAIRTQDPWGSIFLQIMESAQNAKTDTKDRCGTTIGEAFWQFYKYRYSEDAPKKVTANTRKSVIGISHKLDCIWDRDLEDLTLEELQDLINAIPLSKGMVTKTYNLIKGIYHYAAQRKLCQEDLGELLILPDTKPVRHYEDFTDEELKIMWDHADNPMIRSALIMCYSGFRITEYTTIHVDLDNGYFQGGMKTLAGKDRIVPVHSLIEPLVRAAMANGGILCRKSTDRFRRMFEKELERIGIDHSHRHHSPHSTRHTFSRLCESYAVSEADRKRMLGHSFGNDITNGVYGHRTVEELRREIEKIKLPV